MQKIQRVGVKSVAKISFFVLFFFGLINALVLTVSTFLGIGQTTGGSPASFVLIAIFPFAYGLIGLVVGVVCVFIYNFIAARFGGIEVELR